MPESRRSSPASRSNPNRRSELEEPRKPGARFNPDHRGSRKLCLSLDPGTRRAYQQAGDSRCQHLGIPHLPDITILFNPIPGSRPGVHPPPPSKWGCPHPAGPCHDQDAGVVHSGPDLGLDLPATERPQHAPRPGPRSRPTSWARWTSSPPFLVLALCFSHPPHSQEYLT